MTACDPKPTQLLGEDLAQIVLDPTDARCALLLHPLTAFLQPAAYSSTSMGLVVPNP
jgi:hypothetical protein